MNEHRVVREPHVLWRRTLDAVVVLAPSSEEPVVVDGAGPEVWHLVQEPRTTDELAEQLRSSGVPRAAVAEAVARLVRARAVRELS